MSSNVSQYFPRQHVKFPNCHTSYLILSIHVLITQLIVLPVFDYTFNCVFKKGSCHKYTCKACYYLTLSPVYSQEEPKILK